MFFSATAQGFIFSGTLKETRQTFKNFSEGELFLEI